jgi:hypothetical protein
VTATVIRGHLEVGEEGAVTAFLGEREAVMTDLAQAASSSTLLCRSTGPLGPETRMLAPHGTNVKPDTRQVRTWTTMSEASIATEFVPMWASTDA